MKNTELITVIIPAYNVGSYIQQCLESILKQSIGKENIKIIIIDDNSSDATKSVINNFKERHSNVELIENRRNLGPGASRNIGIKKSISKYIAFIDADDYIDLNTFKFLINKMEKTISDIGIYDYEYVSDSGKHYSKNPSTKLCKLNSTIERWQFAQYPELVHALGSANKIYKRSIINTSEPFEEGKKFEDGIFSISTLTNSRKIFVTDKVKYYYRKREDNNNPSGQDQLFSSLKSYKDHLFLNERLKKIKDTNPDLEYSINWLNARTWTPFLQNIFTKKTSFNINANDQKNFYIKSKNIFEGIDVNNLYEDGIDDYQKELIKITKNTNVLFYARLKYLFYRASRRAKLNTNTLSIIYNLFTNKVTKGLELLNVFFEYYYLLPFSIRLNNKSNDIWLFCERGDEAKDNAYFLYEYIKKHHKDIDAYYLISKDAPVNDVAKIKKLGGLIIYGSRKHKLLFLASAKLISTNARGYIEPWKYPNTLKVMGNKYWKKRFVFLQHGVIKDDLSKSLGAHSQSAKFDIFICGAKKEYEYVKNSFGYKNDEVKYTGLARFDKLHKQKSSKTNKILFMPTWRSYIVDSSWNQKMKLPPTNDMHFINSEYYKKIQEFINNEELAKQLNENKFKLVFYPHYEVQPYIKYFYTNNDNVLIANNINYSVQDLLIDSDILITDYSSVFMDYAYMKKPIIYYQFDKVEFFNNHYNKGYFSYEKDGFGPVCYDLNGLKDYLGVYMKHSSPQTKYTIKSDEFFTLNDTNNCERIYNEIVKLK